MDLRDFFLVVELLQIVSLPTHPGSSLVPDG